MMGRLRDLIVAAVLASGEVALARVVPVDLNADGKAAAFLDAAAGLYWSVPDVASPANFEAASSSIAALVIEGRSNWRLPSTAEFNSLNAAQGRTGLAMTAAPFPDYTATVYWTTTSAAIFDAADNYAYLPGASLSMPFRRTDSELGVWAVSSVPESGTALLSLAGLLVLYGARRIGERRS